MYTITYIIIFIYITVHPYITFYILYVQHLIIFGVAFHLLKNSATFEAPSQLDWKQYGHLGGLQLGHDLFWTQCRVCLKFVYPKIQ